jgi:hypothetical protein
MHSRCAERSPWGSCLGPVAREVPDIDRFLTLLSRGKTVCCQRRSGGSHPVNRNGRRRVAGLCVAVTAMAGVLVVSPAHRSQGFTPGNHDLATIVLRTFLRSGVYDEIVDEHDWADSGVREDVPWIHADTDPAAPSLPRQSRRRSVPASSEGNFERWRLRADSGGGRRSGRALAPSCARILHGTWKEAPGGASDLRFLLWAILGLTFESQYRLEVVVPRL